MGRGSFRGCPSATHLAGCGSCGGTAAAISALRSFDNIYPQPNEESALQQLQIQLRPRCPMTWMKSTFPSISICRPDGTMERGAIGLLSMRHSDL